MSHRLLFAVLALGAHSLAAAACPKAGTTYTHYAIGDTSMCSLPGGNPNILAAGPIIARYGESGVRDTVRKQLHDMRDAGNEAIRTIIWYTSDEIRKNWGPVHAPLTSEEQANLRAFAEDVAAAGYSEWLITFGPQGSNNMHCKKVTWGDCYDPALEKVNWQFISAGRDLLMSAVKGRLEMRFDLSNEACTDPHLPPTAIEYMTQGVKYFIQQYVAKYGAGDMEVSCGKPIQPRLKALLRIYDDLGIKPTHLDIHTYQTGQEFADELDFAAKAAEQYGATLTIGEMFYQNREQDEIIGRAVASHPNTKFDAVFQWPLITKEKDPGRGERCHMDVPPPYSAKMLHELVCTAGR